MIQKLTINSNGAQYTVQEKDGTVRPMTEVEIDRWHYPLDRPLDVLADLDAADADAYRCERCNSYHPEIDYAPIRTMYADGNDPQPLLCPWCVQEWDEYWDAMWAEYRSSQGI